MYGNLYQGVELRAHNSSETRPIVSDPHGLGYAVEHKLEDFQILVRSDLPEFIGPMLRLQKKKGRGFLKKQTPHI